MSETLSHHGIKGMKWGVRKKRPTSSNSSKEKSQESSSSKVNKTSDMSDNELRSKIQRIELEKRYAELTKPANKQVSKGRKMAGEILERSVINGTTSALTKQIDKLLTSKLDNIVKNVAK